MSSDRLIESDILVYNNRDPLYGMSREDYIALLKKRLDGRVLKAYFFGSFTGENFNHDSDIDILLVKNTNIPFVERSFEFEDILDMVPTTDIIVYTPGEFESLIADPSPGFWRSVVGSMVRFL